LGSTLAKEKHAQIGSVRDHFHRRRRGRDVGGKLQCEWASVPGQRRLGSKAWNRQYPAIGTAIKQPDMA